MALIRWGDEEEDKDKLNSQIKTVSSVQSSWQPALSGADSAVATDDVVASSPNNGIFDQRRPEPQAQPEQRYLVSDQKAQVDQEKIQRDAEIAEARRQAAQRAAAIQAAQKAKEFREGQVENQQGQQLNVDEIKQDEGWRKYYDEAFEQEKSNLGFWGRLMDGGDASRRAEVMARNRYSGELIRQAYDDGGNVIDADAARRARGLTAYNSALAEDNSTRSRAAGEAIGAFDKNDSGFWGRVNDSVNAIRQMSVFDAGFGVDDKQNFGANDVFRFGGNVIQGVATAIPIGGKAGYEAIRGKGTDYSTGFEKELDASERVGRGISGGIDVAGTFFGGSGKLVQSLGAKTVKGTATQAEKTLLKKLTSEFIIPSLVEGGEAGAQAAAEYFGNDGTLLDENGEIDPEKVAEMLTQTGQAAALGIAAGGVFTGTAAGVNRFRRRGGGANAGSLGEFEYSPLEDTNIDFEPRINEEVTPVGRGDVEALEGASRVNTEVTPIERVADGVVETTPVNRPDTDVVTPPETPVADGVVSAEPVINEAPTTLEPNLERQFALEPTEIARQQALPLNEVTPVADGIVRSDVSPVRDEGLTPVGTDEVRQLQDERIGKTQAEEAAINQRLQELKSQKPQIFFHGTDEKFDFNDIKPGTKYTVDTTGVMGIKDGKQQFGNSDGFSITRSKDVANGYGKNTVEVQISPTAKIATAKDFPEVFKQFEDGKYYNMADAIKLAKDAGYDGIDVHSFELETPKPAKSQEIQIFNKEVLVNPKAETSLLKDVAPVKAENLPEMEVPGDGSLTPAKVAERLMPKLADNSDVKARIAEVVGMGKDTASPIRDILNDGNVKPKQAERIASQFEKLEKQVMEYNRLEEQNQRAYAEDGTESLDPEVSRSRSRTAREMGITTRRLMRDIKRLEGSRDFKVGMINRLTDVIGTRNASILSSAGLLERNIFQEITANAKLAIKNPIKMAKSTFGEGNILKDTARTELSNWKDAPRTPIEAVKYVVGNTYRTGMIPTTALANTRRGAVRRELTQWAFKELEGRDLSPAETKKLAGTAGNEMEALVNTFMGVDNGMTNRKQATDALAAWKEYIRTGDDGARAKFLEKVENHNSLADQMIAGLSKEDTARARGLMAMKNLIFPFVRTATNLAKNTVRQDLNPFAKSLLDEIRADQRSGGANAVNLVKSKLVDYGIMSGAAALAGSGVLVYNDGDEVDKPRGWSIKTGDDTYMPVRSTSLELPLALAGTAQQMASDIGSGDARDWKYYAGMITNSLPYIDQFNTTTGAVDSLTSGEDGGYAAKSYAVNTAKSFVPFSNNSVQAYVAGKQGESLNAKSVYDKNMLTWFGNTLRKSYDPDFYDSLKDSRDNAGRVRTVDNQGIISNKTINDPSTAEFNDRISDLVDYGRRAGLGKNTQDMFNTYDTGKNNNFKSIQDSITFLDVEDGGKPDNAKKLEKNAKLTNLSQQIRDGFFGDSGSELLTLDGKNLYSDVSVPNKNGTKNSKLPISMQSIKNAIAQTDLPEADRDTMYEISQKNDDLYARFKAKNISYDQYAAEKAKNEQTYTAILNKSENYQKMLDLFDELDDTGFFDADGLGSTKSGQTYLWNALNALLGSKGATPAANYPDNGSGFTPWGGGNGKRASNKPGDRGNEGIRWSPVKARQLAAVAQGRYTPLNVKIKLGNEVKKDKTQNFTDRTI